METRARRVRGAFAFVSKVGAGLLLALSLAVLSCSDGGVAGSSSSDVDATPDVRGDSSAGDRDGSGDTRGGSGDSSGGFDTSSLVDADASGSQADGDAAGGTQVYRFIVMGDTGEGNQEQKRVSEGAQSRCDQAGGCHGFLMLGDNIYDSGAESSNDKEFTTKIDKPYRNLKYGAPPPSGQPDNRKRLPIYVSLGNHDLGEIPLNREKINYNIDYGKGKDWYHFPAEIWEKKIGPVHLLALHTNPLAYEGMRFEMHTKMVQRVLQNTSAEWTIAFGHHPYRSNGQHGNAGDYEQIPLFGDEYREWVNKQICGKVDFLLTGHDHNRQWIKKMEKLQRSFSGGSGDICDTHMAVSGAGAKTRDIEDRGNDTAFASDKLGFLFLEFRSDRVEAEFCDADGNTEWSKTITK